MSSISIPQLFSFLESQVGRPALASALAAYLAVPSEAPPSTPPKAQPSAPAEPPAAPQKAKKVKADAPKREPNAWVVFTCRVRSVLTPLAPEGKKLLPVAVTQTASALKDAGLMGTATDEQIRAAYAEWQANPPPVSKMVRDHQTAAERRARKDKKSKSSDASSATSAESSVAKTLVEALDAVAPKKHRGPKKLTEMTPEELEAHNAKKAARKAAKKGTATPPLPPSPKLEAAPAPDVDPLTDFEPFLWKKMDLFKNARGDVFTDSFEWFGRFVNGKMDTTAPQPEDLDL
jgi:hypothetical protein